MELLARTCRAERMNVERFFARAFVVLGGVFWVSGVFGASFTYQDRALSDSVTSALVPFAVAMATLIIGWFYEQLAASLLVIGSVVVVAWGIVAGWEVGVWLTMTAILIGPMVIAAALFALAARMQRICSPEELEGV